MIEKDVPIIVHYSEPLAILAINDQLFGLLEYDCHEFYPERAYNSLFILYKNEKTRLAIPKRFHHFFIKNAFSVFYPCFSGNIGDGRNNCFIFKLKIDENQSYPVRLYDLALSEYTDYGYYITNLDLDVEFTADDAFLFFANSCVAAAYVRLDSFFEFGSFEKFDYDLFMAIYNKHKEFLQKNSYNKKLQPIYEFSFEYLEYLSEKIIAEDLSPEKILYLNGSRILSSIASIKFVKQYIIYTSNELIVNYNNLSPSQKYLYYSLLILTHYHSKKMIPEIENIFTRGKSKLTEIYNDLKKSFPYKQTNLQKNLY